MHCWVSFSGFAEVLFECWHTAIPQDKLDVLSGILSEVKHCKETTLFKADGDRETLMAKIEEERVFNGPYTHIPTAACKNKGITLYH